MFVINYNNNYTLFIFAYQTHNKNDSMTEEKKSAQYIQHIFFANNGPSIGNLMSTMSTMPPEFKSLFNLGRLMPIMGDGYDFDSEGKYGDGYNKYNNDNTTIMNDHLKTFIKAPEISRSITEYAIDLWMEKKSDFPTLAELVNHVFTKSRNIMYSYMPRTPETDEMHKKMIEHYIVNCGTYIDYRFTPYILSFNTLEKRFPTIDEVLRYLTSEIRLSRADPNSDEHKGTPTKDLDKIEFKDYKSEDEREKFCTMCQDEFKNGDKYCKLPCQHIFHKDGGGDSCPGIVGWLKDNNTCPVCKKEVKLC